MSSRETPIWRSSRIGTLLTSHLDSSLWDEHLDELIQVFVDGYLDHGGPQLDVAEVKLHILLILVVSGVSYYMNAPLAITREIANLDAVVGYQDEYRNTDS